MSAATWLGVDVSTKKIAVAGLRYDGTIEQAVLFLDPDGRGARRLHEAREQVTDRLRGIFGPRVDAVCVETPWAGTRPSYPLLGLAAVCLEAIQATWPGAVVMDVTTGEWKRETLGDGHGNATKEQVMTHVRAAHGYSAGDQDVADALAMAECARERWWASMTDPEEAAA